MVMERRGFLRACLAAGGLVYVPKLVDRYRWQVERPDNIALWLKAGSHDGELINFTAVTSRRVGHLKMLRGSEVVYNNRVPPDMTHVRLARQPSGLWGAEFSSAGDPWHAWPAVTP